MRLYRGLKNPYRPELVAADHLSGTDFTDCPATALRYAHGARGVLLVVEIAEGDDVTSARVTPELWLGVEAKRLMVWGKFDAFVTAVLPAKDLRARIRREGLRNATDAAKARLLRSLIDAQPRRTGQSTGRS